MNSAVKRIALFLISVFVLCYVGYQAVRYLYSPYKTETVLKYTVNDSCEVKGVAFREEQVLTSSQGGVVSYLMEDGSKVSQNIPVADIYAEETDAKNQVLIKELNQEIAMLTAAQDPGSTAVVHTDVLSKQITEKFSKMASIVSSGFIGDLPAYQNEFLTLFNRRNIVTGKEAGYADRIAELTAQRDQLEASLTRKPSKISSPVSGYFVSKSDGLETTLAPQALSGLTAASLQEYYKNDGVAQEPSVIGKIITDYEWHIAALVPKADIDKFHEGYKAYVSFINSTMEEVPVVIGTVQYDAGADYGVVVLKCDYLSSGTSTFRNEAVIVGFRDYNGIKINSKAIRFNDKNEMGVYVKIGQEIRFKKIDQIFVGEGYVLSKEMPDDSDYLQMFDEVIVEGKDLYDRKPI